PEGAVGEVVRGAGNDTVLPGQIRGERVAAGVGQGHAADDVGAVPAQRVHLEFDVFVGFGRHHLGADVLDELGGWEHVPVTGAEHTVLAFGGLAVGFGGVDRVGEFDAPVAGAGLLVVGAPFLGHGL